MAAERWRRITGAKRGTVRLAGLKLKHLSLKGGASKKVNVAVAVRTGNTVHRGEQARGDPPSRDIQARDDRRRIEAMELMESGTPAGERLR
jgi:hypothetical protein